MSFSKFEMRRAEDVDQVAEVTIEDLEEVTKRFKHNKVPG